MWKRGDDISNYRVEGLLAKSDVGPTYRVRRDGVTYVLRILDLPDPAFQERLRRAGQAQQEIDHPNVVRVHQVIETRTGPGLICEFVTGGDLAGWIAKGPHDVRATIRIFEGLLKGLQACHDAGVLHRNLKPDKVLLTRDGQAKVNDFVFGRVDGGASAHLTAANTTFGTPQFMAPEQFHGASMVDECADLFSAGCILYEMLTCTRAFPGNNLMEIYNAISSGVYVPLHEARPGLPVPLISLCADLMAIEVDDRPQSAKIALERLATVDLSALAVDDDTFEATLAAKAQRRMQMQLAGCGCAGLLALVAMVIACLGWAL